MMTAATVANRDRSHEDTSRTLVEAKGDGA